MSRQLLGGKRTAFAPASFVVLACLVLTTTWNGTHTQAKTIAAEAYGGHRVLVWVVDPAEAQVRGFSEITLRPGEERKLTPAAKYDMTVSLGQIEKSEVHQAGRTWTEPAVRFTTRSPVGGRERTLDLLSASIQVEFPSPRRSPLALIWVVTPIGALKSAKMSKLLAPKLKGELTELEDLLIAAAAEGELDADTAGEVYTVLPKTSRKDEWLRLMNGKDKRAALTASAALSRLHDTAAQERFAKYVTKAQGDEKVDLINVLCAMPQSDVFRDVMLKLLLAPGPYLLEGPAADMDRRHGLLRALGKYPESQIAPHADKLRKWGHGDGKQFRDQLEQLLKPRDPMT